MAPRPAKQAPQETPALALVGVVEEPGQALVAPAAVTTPTPATLLQMAVQQGADLDKLERLMALQERWEANEARKAFVEAMVAFKSEDLTIGKNKHVKFKTNSGFTEYDHAELADVVGVIVPALARHGISHAWTFRQDSSGATVGCVLTHRLGHRSDPIEMTAAADNSGGKNAIQAIASTKTYLERYTLLAATGLATGGVALPGPSDDDDGHGFESGNRGDSRPQDSTADEAAVQRERCDAAAKRHAKAVEVIQDEIGKFDVSQDTKHLYTVREAWSEIPDEDKRALWLATSKGGVFTTHEREVMRRLPRPESEE